MLTFHTSCPDGSHLTQTGSHFVRITPPTPVLYSAVTNTFWRYVCTQNTPNPTPKHPFSWPELESGQNELQSGQNGPNRAKCLKSGQNSARSGQKYYSSSYSHPPVGAACLCANLLVQAYSSSRASSLCQPLSAVMLKQ